LTKVQANRLTKVLS